MSNPSWLLERDGFKVQLQTEVEAETKKQKFVRKGTVSSKEVPWLKRRRFVLVEPLNEVFSPKVFALRHVQLVEDEIALTVSRSSIFPFESLVSSLERTIDTVLLRQSEAYFSSEAEVLLIGTKLDIFKRFETHKDQRRQKHFEPSVLLTGYVLKEFEVSPADAQREVASRLREVVIGMLQSVADAHAYSGSTEPYRISVGTRFSRLVAKAIHERLDIDPYDGVDFLNQLHRELEAACPLSINNWTLDGSSDGSLSLSSFRDSQQVAAGPLRERAEVVRMKFGRRSITGR